VIRALLYQADGKPLVILGLGEENMRRLREGEPIRFNLKHLDPGSPKPTDLPDVDLVIAFDDGSLTPALMTLGKSQGSPPSRRSQ
jgi:hypothetical protein